MTKTSKREVRTARATKPGTRTKPSQAEDANSDQVRNNTAAWIGILRSHMAAKARPSKRCDPGSRSVEIGKSKGGSQGGDHAAQRTIRQRSKRRRCRTRGEAAKAVANMWANMRLGMRRCPRPKAGRRMRTRVERMVGVRCARSMRRGAREGSRRFEHVRGQMDFAAVGPCERGRHGVRTNREMACSTMFGGRNERGAYHRLTEVMFFYSQIPLLCSRLL